MGLTPKQQVFVNSYLATWNASEAARRASYANPGQQGHRLLKNVEIAEEIKRRLDDQTMTANEVLVRLTEQARGVHTDYISATGSINVPLMVAENKTHLIKGIKETQFGKVIEFYDSQAALVHIGKHHGLFSDKIEHSGSVDLVVKGYVTVNPDDWDDD